MSLQVHKIPGQLPERWDRSVIFFANLLSLFYGNEAETQVLRDEVGALETYGSRLIPVIDILFKKGSNILVLERQPDETLLNYFQSTLGLSLPQIKVLPHNDYLKISDDASKTNMEKLLAQLKSAKAQWLDGYVTDFQLQKIAEFIGKKTISTVEGSKRGNNKLLLHQHMESCGLPVFDTFISDDEIGTFHALEDLKKQGYRHAVVKASIGASGIGMIKVDLNDLKVDIPKYLYYEGPCLVQGWLDETFDGVQVVGSPSVQMFLSDDDLTLHDITEQILSKESVHEGNIAPPRFMDNEKLVDELLNQAEVAGKWLHEQGYRGTASTDFLLVEKKGEMTVYVCEVNARVTGATYPSMLARKFLPHDVWLMRNVRFSPPQEGEHLLEIFKETDLLFEPDKKHGILPINLNINEKDEIIKGQFLFLGNTHDSVLSLLKKMSEHEKLQGVYDRD